jgi:hypothetical protein
MAKDAKESKHQSTNKGRVNSWTVPGTGRLEGKWFKGESGERRGKLTGMSSVNRSKSSSQQNEMVNQRVAAAAGQNNRIMASLRDLASKYLLCTTPVRQL